MEIRCGGDENDGGVVRMIDCPRSRRVVNSSCGDFLSALMRRCLRNVEMVKKENEKEVVLSLVCELSAL